MANTKLSCSFCGKNQDLVKKLIAASTHHICDECVNLCYSIINEKPKSLADEKLPSPSSIKKFLDEYVIGQDFAKEVLSVAVYNHYKRLENQVIDDVEIDKSNVLIMGPSGCGKTFLAQTIARLLNVPFAIADATSLTEAGYVGDDVESIITRLLQSAEGDVARAERGIIFIDEIDKKRVKGEGGSGTRDVSGEGVQQALLKIIEGSDVFVPPTGSKKNHSTQNVRINTKNILFIVGGAFVGIDKVISQELDKGRTTIGFGASNDYKERSLAEVISHLEPTHLVSFGLIPEIIGRLPIIAALDELSEDQLVHVLSQPKNAITKQFEKMFLLDGIELEFHPDALKAVAKKALKSKTGARALRGVIENVLRKTQFMLPDLKLDGVSKIIITKEVVDNMAPPVYVRENIEAVSEQ